MSPRNARQHICQHDTAQADNKHSSQRPGHDTRTEQEQSDLEHARAATSEWSDTKQGEEPLRHEEKPAQASRVASCTSTLMKLQVAVPGEQAA